MIKFRMNSQILYKILAVLRVIPVDIDLVVQEGEIVLACADESMSTLVCARINKSSLTGLESTENAAIMFNTDLLHQSLLKMERFDVSLEFSSSNLLVEAIGMSSEQATHGDLPHIEYRFPLTANESTLKIPSLKPIYLATVSSDELRSDLERLSIVSSFFSFVPEEESIGLIAENDVYGKCNIVLPAEVTHIEDVKDHYLYALKPLVDIVGKIDQSEKTIVSIAGRGVLHLSTEVGYASYDLFLAQKLE